MRIAAYVSFALGIMMLTWGVHIGFDMTKPQNPNVLPKVYRKPGNYPIVRLHDWESGRFFCSGTIVSDKYLATAAHCVQDYLGNMSYIEVRDQHGKSFNPIIIALVAGQDQRNDQAMLEGRFQEFDKMRMEHRPKPILNAFFRADNNIILCGYPYGGDLICLPFKNPRQYVFQIQGISSVYPGMSGGPVIDLHTNKVIAVNTAANESHVIVSPLTEIFNVLGIAQ